MNGPKKFTESELKKVGVILTDAERGLLHCDNCGGGWMLNHRSGRRAPFWWVCPHCKHNDPRAPF